MLIAQGERLFLVIMALILLFALVNLLWMAKVFRYKLQALTTGVRLSMMQIVAMQVRRTDVNVVLRALMMATQAGAPLSAHQVERAYLQGVDLEKLVLAYVRVKKENLDITFEQLVEADLDHRLEEKLKGQ